MIGPLTLGWVFLRMGSLFFGGGYVLLPLLHQELVLHLGWLSYREFIDGTALSQITPGPVAILATFAGYLRGGISGALVATGAIFLPGVLLMLVLSRSYARLRHIPGIDHFLAVLSPAVTGLLLAAAWEIGKATPGSWRNMLLALGALGALLRFRIHPALLLFAAALMGWAFPS